MGVIIFGGRSSADYGIHVESYPEYTMPQREYEAVHVPGKSGDVIFDKGSYTNTTRVYPISFGEIDGNFTTMASALSRWLHSSFGYLRLEDSYEPEYYRMAVYDETATIENILGQSGRGTITFNCKPQRFLKSGERPVIFTSSGVLKNGTGQVALPVITVYGNGNGSVTIGDYEISLSGMNEYIVINSEIQDCYKGMENANGSVTLPSGFPRIDSGEISVSFGGSVTKVEIIPNWWII